MSKYRDFQGSSSTAGAQWTLNLLSRADLDDVAKMLGITVPIAERHYAPYVRELQERGRRLVLALDFAPG